MKKVFAILVVLALVAGFAFADLPAANTSETHKITLKTVVVNTLPQFRLTAAIASASQYNNADSVVTNDTPNDFGSVTAAEATKQIQVADISTTDISATFTASLENKAKTGGTYTLTFGATAFTNVWKSVEDPTTHVVSVSQTETVPVHAISLANLTSDLATTGITIGTVDNTTDADHPSVVISFNGQECTEGDIVRLTVEYESDPTVIDNNGVGYFADVTMVVTYNG